jgi:urease accessory protein
MQGAYKGKGISSELRAVFERRGDRTVMTDAFFTSPLKLTKTFPVEKTSGGISATVMDISPGLMDGDRYELAWDIGAGCHVAVTTQSYAKVHPCPMYGAVQSTRISVGADASLIYAPQPTMLYADAALQSKLEIDLADGASLLLLDTLCAGRTHYGETFRYRSFESEVGISAGGRLLAANRLWLRPAEQRLEAPGIYEGFTHNGTLYAFGPFVNRTALEAVLASVQERSGVRCGASLAARSGLTAMALGNTAWEVHEALLHMARTLAAFARSPESPSPTAFAWPKEW